MLMWISGLQKVLLGRFLGPKFGDLGVQFGDLGAQIEVPEGPLGAGFGDPKASSWQPFRGLLGHLEPTWRPLGAILAATWGQQAAQKPPRAAPGFPTWLHITIQID